MKYLLLVVIVFVFLPQSMGKICPLEDHYVCNKDVSRHSCVCALVKSENPAPEKSCNLVANIIEDKFEASSITFNLDDSSEQFNTFPEVAFKKEVASALKVKVSDIVIVRLRCTDSDKKLTVQFLILKENNTAMQVNVSTLKTVLNEDDDDDDEDDDKKESDDDKDDTNEETENSVDDTEENNDNDSKDASKDEDNDKDDDDDDDDDDDTNEKEDKDGSDSDDDNKDKKSKKNKNDDDDNDDEKSDEDEDNEDDDDESAETILYKQSDFIDSDIIVKKMKTMGHMSQIADLDVDEIEVVKSLYSIENDTTNFVLFIQAVLLIIVVILTCVCGCWMSCKKNDYSDDLQKV
uniref:ZP domain-containing protein n=1 Tax=Strongyloides stercoralis TaxID=6248 RepID=A0A0K0EG80_STRER